MTKIPWRSIRRSRLALLKVPICLLIDHRVTAKKGERQDVAVDLARGLKLDKFQIEALKSVENLYMECLRCGMVIKIRRKITNVKQPRTTKR